MVTGLLGGWFRTLQPVGCCDCVSAQRIGQDVGEQGRGVAGRGVAGIMKNYLS